MKVVIWILVLFAACLAATGGHLGARPTGRDQADLASPSPSALPAPAPDTWLGSDTKVFTATMIARLADAGRLSLDDPVGDLLPWYRQDTGQRMTVRHLLGHTSGLPDDARLAADAREPGVAIARAVVANWCSRDLQWEPGTRWEYSNAGYAVLGAIVEEVTGKTYVQAMQDLVLAPAATPAAGSGDDAAQARSEVSRPPRML